MNQLVLTLTTGRTGTNFIYNFFNELDFSHVEICHEVHTEQQTYPRHTWRKLSKTNCYFVNEVHDLVEEHSRTIKTEYMNDNRTVIILGWTLSHLIPLYKKIFDNLKVLHLIRNPIFQSASRATSGRYHFFDPHGILANIDPFVSNFSNPQFKPVWNEVGPFMKNLFRWYEYNKLADEFCEQHDLEIYTMKSENLFEDPVDELHGFAKFSGINPRENNFLERSREINFNEVSKNSTRGNETFNKCYPIEVNWNQIDQFPRIRELKDKYSYKGGYKTYLDKLNRKYVYEPRNTGEEVFWKIWAFFRFLRRFPQYFRELLLHLRGS